MNKGLILFLRAFSSDESLAHLHLSGQTFVSFIKKHMTKGFYDNPKTFIKKDVSQRICVTVYMCDHAEICLYRELNPSQFNTNESLTAVDCVPPAFAVHTDRFVL